MTAPAASDEVFYIAGGRGSGKTSRLLMELYNAPPPRVVIFDGTPKSNPSPFRQFGDAVNSTEHMRRDRKSVV